MVNSQRTWFFIMAWALVVAILIQVFFAGAALLADPLYWDYHFIWGGVGIPAVAGILALFIAVSKVSRNTLWLGIITFVLSFGTPGFVVLRGTVIAGLHPVAAVILFGLAMILVLRSREFVPPPWGRASEA